VTHIARSKIRSGLARIAGFTLLEAIVALVIFSSAAIGIYGWINVNLISLNRVAEVADAELVVQSSLERLKLVDLTSEAEGAFNVGEYLVSWQAELMEPVRLGRTAQGAIGLYDLGLYKIDLELTKNGRFVSHFDYRYCSRKQAREATYED